MDDQTKPVTKAEKDRMAYVREREHYAHLYELQRAFEGEWYEIDRRYRCDLAKIENLPEKPDMLFYPAVNR